MIELEPVALHRGMLLSSTLKADFACNPFCVLELISVGLFADIVVP